MSVKKHERTGRYECLTRIYKVSLPKLKSNINVKFNVRVNEKRTKGNPGRLREGLLKKYKKKIRTKLVW